MKIKFFLMLFFATIILSCSSEEGDDTNEDIPDGGTTTATTITFENSTFSGSVLITYTDGSTKNENFINGTLSLPNSSEGNKTIASLQPQNQDFILIGRKEGGTIKLNYNNGTLLHRVGVGGFIPIGTYAEFQLINKNAATLSGTYKLEADLDLMSLGWIPIGGVYNELPSQGGLTPIETFHFQEVLTAIIMKYII